MIPPFGQRCTGEISKYSGSSSLCQYAAPSITGKTGEGTFYVDRDIAFKSCAPKIERALIGDKALLANGFTSVTTDRFRRGWIVETNIRRISIDQLEFCAGGSQGKRKAKQSGRNF